MRRVELSDCIKGSGRRYYPPTRTDIRPLHDEDNLLTLHADRLRSVALLALVMASAARLNAQTPPASTTETTTTLPRAALENLPSSGTVSGLLETTVPELISDRIEGGGLSVGGEARLGARGSSWTQTAFQFDEVDLTDAGLFGGSLLFLDPMMLDAVETSTAMMPLERPAPGVGVRLVPRRPSDTWRGQAEFLSTVSAADAPTDPVPPIQTLRSWNRFAASASGPLHGTRLGGVFGLAVNDASRFDRNDPTILHAQDTTGFANFLYRPSTTDEVLAVVAGRSAHIPYDGRLWLAQPDARQSVSDFVAESHWNHQSSSLLWIVAGGFRHVSTNDDTRTVPLAYIDSIHERPIMDAVAGSVSRQRWSVVLRERPLSTTRNLWLRGARAGFELGGGSNTDGALVASDVAESVEGVPARIWRFTNTTTTPRQHVTTPAAYFAESIPGPRLLIDAGVRWEGVWAAASGGESIRWSDWFPRASLTLDLLPRQHLSAVVGVARHGYRLPLESLSYGDPAAVGADVFPWDDRNGNGRFELSEAGPLVARVGNAAPGVSSIDANVKRPYMDEFLVGLEFRPSHAWTVRFAGTTRQEHRLLAAINTGVPISAYTVATILDAGENWIDSSDDRPLPVYSRRPEAFGADRYLLTNPDSLSATFRWLDLTVDGTTDRLSFRFGATAGQSSGPAAARGFQAFQNDFAVAGDVLVNPNSTTYARGSFFSDRTFTIKTSGTYRFPYHVQLGVVARYQDGQPFSRLVIVTDPAQGTEAIRAYRNGRTRFTYTMTVDTRLQVGLPIANRRLAVVWDAFNLFNQSSEVEEFVLTAPAFRNPTALQPARAMRLGLRATF
jgi:hypothetical protein